MQKNLILISLLINSVVFSNIKSFGSIEEIHKSLSFKHAPMEMLIKTNVSEADLKSQLKESFYSVKNVESFSLADKAWKRVSFSNLESNLKSAKEQHYFEVKLMASLSQNPIVAFVEPNYIYKKSSLSSTPVTNDPELKNQWALKQSGVSDFWKRSQGSKKILVGVIDTGVDYTHPDLIDNLWFGLKSDGKKYYGYNGIVSLAPVDPNNPRKIYLDELDPEDDNSHGTHVAGIIGAKGNNNIGVSGVNWDARIISAKFLNDKGSGVGSDAIKCLDWLVAKNIDVVNNSWGGGGRSQAMFEAIDRARAKGIVFIAAAGNSYSNNDKKPVFPADYNLSNVISVGSIEEDTSKSDFSNYAKASVDILAPGGEILSTIPTSKFSSNGTPGYDVFSGTSMAAPMMSGALSLLMSSDSSLSATDAMKKILNYSDKYFMHLNEAKDGRVLNMTNIIKGVIPQTPVEVTETQFTVPEPLLIETAHPYSASTIKTWKISKQGAKYIRVYFSKFDVEKGYDSVNIKNGEGVTVQHLSGIKNNFWSETVEGDELVVELVSDNMVQKDGFMIDKVSHVK